MARNARFWTWLNDGWVKITLLPEQTLTHHTGGPTDEGYSYTTLTYEHEGDAVRCEESTAACDCDGRLDRGCESYCRLDDLRQRDMGSVDECGQWRGDEYVACPENAGIFAPSWIRADRWQRDYAAEAAGY